MRWILLGLIPFVLAQSTTSTAEEPDDQIIKPRKSLKELKEKRREKYRKLFKTTVAKKCRDSKYQEHLDQCEIKHDKKYELFYCKNNAKYQF